MLRIFPLWLLFMLCSISGIGQTVNLRQGLIGHYLLDGNSLDQSPNLLHGRLSGTLQATEDRFGNVNSALRFDGNTYVRVPVDPALTVTDISYSAWIQTDTPENTWQTILDIDRNEQYYGVINNQLSIWGRCEDDIRYGSINRNWYHVVWVVEGNLSKVYINGAEVGVKENCTEAIGVSNIYIGAEWNGSFPFNGILDDIRIYNRAISSAEVTALYIEGNVPLDASLVLEDIFILDEGSNTLKAKVQNVGQQAINSLDIEWEIDGVVRTSNVPVNLQPRDTATLVLGELNLSPGRLYELQAWVKQVNAQADNNTANDTSSLKTLIVNPREPHHALSFSNRSFVNIAPSPELVVDKEITMEAWVFPTGRGSAGSFGGIILNKEEEYEMARFGDGTLRFAFGSGQRPWGSTDWINSNYILPLGVWTHIAVTFNAGEIKTYANGDLVFVQMVDFIAIRDFSNLYQSELRIGGRTNGNQHFDGVIDEVRIWNVARSQEQIVQAMVNNNGLANEVGLIAAWHFGENKGNEAFNLMGNHKGQLFNGVKWVASDAPIGDNQYNLDAGLTDILLKQDSQQEGHYDVFAVVRNFGRNDLNSAQINWSINNQTQPPFSWSGNLPSQEIDTVKLGTHRFTSGRANDISASLINPNGRTDPQAANNQATISNVYTALAGTFTIGGPNADFDSLKTAVEVLNTAGIMGDVTFYINSGTYVEQIVINEFPGSSCERKVVFRSATGNREDVKLYFQARRDANYIVQLNGADGVHFENLSFEEAGTSYNRIFDIRNGADCNVIRNCHLWCEPETSNSTNLTLIFSPNSGESNKNTLIENNLIENSSVGVGFYGKNEGTKILNNTILNQYWIGIELDGYDSPIVSGNIISTSSRNDGFFGILLDNQGGQGLIEKNRIYTNGGYGIMISDGRQLNRITNNFVNINGSSRAYGIYLQRAANTQIYHNSVNVKSTSLNDGIALYINGGSDNAFIIQNNIFANLGGGYAISNRASNAFSSMDFNNLFTNGENLAYFNEHLPDLTAWQNASGADANSLSVDPLFIDDTLGYRVAQQQLNGSAFLLEDVLDDIEGNARDQNPDMGANEFTLVPIDIGVSNISYPKDACGLTATDSIRIEIQNYGSTAQSGFQVAYRLNQAAPVLAEVNQAVEPGKKITFTFSNVDLSQAGTYNLNVYTLLSTDQNRRNDSTGNYQFHNYAPVQAPSELTPANMSSGLDVPLTFSWSPSENVESYDVYLWPEGQNRPNQPLASDITRIRYTYYGQLDYGTSYQWQIVAKNICSTAESEVQNFSLRELPDLVVDTVFRPQDQILLSGKEMTVRWTINNTGKGGTQNTSWFEYITLSRDTILGNNDDIRRGSVKNLSPLDSGENYQQEYTFNLPRDAIGEYYIFISIHSYTLKEFNTDNQFDRSTIISVTPSPHPDLQVSEVTQPIRFTTFSSGDGLPVEWKVVNKGNARTDLDEWHDQIFLSTEATFDARNVISLGQKRYGNRTLEAGGEIIMRDTFDIPVELEGSFMVYVETDVRNRVFEHLADINNVSPASDTFDIIRRSPPDLMVDTVAAPNVAGVRQSISVSWQVSNNGLNSTWNDNWSDAVYLSRLDTFNRNQSVQIGNFRHVGKLDRFTSYNRTGSITIPDLEGGNYYMYVYTDAQNREFEQDNEFNNITRTEEVIQISNPDLVVTEITTPDSLHSGQTFSLSYSFSNQGDGPVFQGRWTDRFYLAKNSNDITSQAYELGQVSQTTPQLNPDNPESRQLSFNIPDGIEGEYYIIARSDVSNRIYESNENNNHLNKRIWIELADYPDLFVAEIGDIPIANAGDQFTFTYQLSNQGTGSTGDDIWTDQIFLSTSNRFARSNARLLASVQQSQPLDAGQSRISNLPITLPITLDQSNYHIFVVTNAGQQVYEHGLGSLNNTRGKAISITPHPPSDLLISDFSLETGEISAGSVFNFSYRVTNQGEGATLYSAWQDALYLSSDPEWDITDIPFQNIAIRQELTAGNSYEIRQRARFPNGFSGSYYILAVADHRGNLNETNTENNYQVSTVSVNGEPVNEGEPTNLNIAYVPPPDLQVSNINAPVVARQGQTIQLSYEVKNTGTGTAGRNNWTDQWVLSSDERFSADDIPLARFVRTDSLIAEDSYNVDLEFSIPINALGNYFLLLKTDATDRVYEENREENNTIVSSIRIDRAFPSDLIVSITEFPEQITIDEPFKVKWQTQNLGPNPAEALLTEAFYLSEDTVLDSDDQFLFQQDKEILLGPLGALEDSAIVTTVEVIQRPYYIIASTDAKDRVVEVNEKNNISPSTNPVQAVVDLLPLNQEVTVELTENRYYRIVIPDELSGESMSVQLQSEIAEAQNLLFLSYEAPPNRAIHEFATRNPLQADQELTVPQLQAGTYYLMARTESASQPVTISAKILEFEMTSVASDKGGNTGVMTVRLEGGQFDNSMLVFLENDDAGSLEAVNVKVIDPTLAFVTFDLAGQPLGIYSLFAEKDNGKTATLTDAFEVISSTARGLTFTSSVGGSNTGSGKFFSCCDSQVEVDRILDVNVSHPEVTRPNRIINITFTVRNDGVVDVPIPYRFLVSVGGAPIARDVNTLDQEFKEVFMEFREKDNPLEVLRPGAQVSITVYTKAVAPLQFQLVE